MRVGDEREKARAVAVVLGDQLDAQSPALAALDKDRDAVVMMEVDEEATAGPSHRQRTAVFFAAMRHFALSLRERGYRVRYATADDPGNTHTLTGEVRRAVKALHAERVVVVRPGDWRVLKACEQWPHLTGAEVEILEDTHFTCSREDFLGWADGRKTLTMEHFYRWRRRELGVLVDDQGQPEGGQWNYDHDNRKAFGKDGPNAPPPLRFEPDEVTREAIELVERRYRDLPGRLDRFGWPVTHDQAREALEDFIEHRLRDFGPYEDAMWTGQPWLFHSQLSVPLNLKLLDPMACVEAAVRAYEQGKAPLNSVEGFVRQIIGWREYVRGIYWQQGPGYRNRNWLDQHGKLPAFYWTGQTDMRCLRECIEPVLEHAWMHHIPRLMVTGNFAMIAGVHPREVGDWYFGMFADSVDWVTTPNTIGMALSADGTDEHGPVVATKPYAAAANYIGKMSNYCKHCPYDPKARTGTSEKGPACPFNTFYWDFMIRNHERFKSNQRMAMILRQVAKMSREEKISIRVSATRLRKDLQIGSIEPPDG
ncbi:MAG: cryptochrome/photolyase family protein [Phycisphaerales bacterium]|nr:MAG: cryptochrome/photolyase family protein [Phycisphaerales bacterium]